MIALEVCVDSLEDARVAASAGIARIELCSALELGGLTPSVGLMRHAAPLGVPIHAMIRPRAGNFHFDRGEFDVMVDDIHAAREAGLGGIVLGALDASDCLDRDGLARLIAHGRGLGLTLHRAFDLAADPFEAMELAIELGFERILTSGGAATAAAGAALISALDRKARGRISIMPGAGVNAATIASIVAGTAIHEVHASCKGVTAVPTSKASSFGFGDTRRRIDLRNVEDLLKSIRELPAAYP